MTINNIAVLGSGVMGSGIAALAANAGCEVTLLDIVPQGAENRNQLAEKGIEKQLAAGGFTHPDNARRITPGNLEDHLPLLAKADWIIEAVLEKLEVKHGVYRRIQPVRKKGCAVSSNTSTIPLHDLVSGIDGDFAKNFMIAHFFNPPRHMRLLEVVAGGDTRPDLYQKIKSFADERLGKQVVECKDTPGFIANRIGVYWLVAGLLEAERLGLTVEQADAVMGRPAGIPKTGVFGLYDLIGIDLIPLIAKEMLHALPESDPFRTLYREPEWLKKMIAEGYTGRKGKGGFYRLVKQGDKKAKEALDLATGQYRPEAKAELPSAKAKNIKELVAFDDTGGHYAWSVLSKTLAYAASLAPHIAHGIADVDAAMTAGYSWKHGPFALIDAIGAQAFAGRLQADGVPVPPLVAEAARRSGFYREENNQPQQLDTGAAGRAYAPIRHAPGHLWLAEVKRRGAPIVSNASANLWDLGDGIACLEFTTKMNAVDANILAFIEQAMPRVAADFQGLVIGSDGDVFCAGANLAVFLEHAQAKEWNAISDIIRRGQQAMLGLKYAPFPVVASLAGMALGGGCEIVLHARAVQAHMESQPGLVEANVGLIPAWGGCKEMLLRHAGPLAAFEWIATAKTAGSADEAREMNMLRECCGISMNRARLLADAKARCLKLAKAYAPPAPAPLKTGGDAARQAMLDRLEALSAAGKASPHGLVIGRALSHVLSGGGTNGEISEQAMLDLEHDGFMELIRTAASQARIEHMLKTGKPLKN